MLAENLVESVAAAIRDNWDRECYSDWEGTTLTYADVAHRICQLHYIFSESGIERGDKIALVGRNSSRWAVTYFAALTYGAVAVPILPDFTDEEIHHVVGHSDAQLLFASDPLYDRLENTRMRGLRGILRIEDYSLRHHNQKRLPDIVATAPTAYRKRHRNRLARGEFQFEPVPGSDLATIVYTSGTTGFSKGVMLNHHSLMVNARYYLDNLDLSRNRRIVSFLPLAHSFGCAFDLIAPTVGGCHTTFIEKTPTPKVLLEAFARVRPVVVLSVPLIIEKIYRNRIKPQLESPTLKTMMKIPAVNRLVYKRIRRRIRDVFGGQFQEVVIGGAAFNREAEQFFRQIGFDVANGYGMTECGPIISYSVVRDRPPLGSVGKIIPYLECRIDVSDQAHGVGEILVRGENVMLGYYKDPEATRAAIDQDGWLHTGDLGRMDENGILFLTGRSKNMILSPSGQNVYPEEIEARLNELPYVMESLVMESGGKICALIHPDLDRTDQDGIGEKELEAIMERNRLELNRQVPAYAAVSRVRLIYTEFEKTPTKKIKRRLYDAFR
ncbi:MAG TPA: AMP-binding protein [Candidatus Krumholzibacteria bacterium]|nr:AMP-binding protein [Candidatus Krumholzibacteria bacterium]HPD70705.1 AMP-binding protein [Candidatus Krumholzibacteria bacterium]HRY39595.1 AMP-binding protein [Candidatus Krumholzibacteria bacterium]